MTELYLIAHVVRGEPAFDIAEKLWIGDEEGWIIPTSGHRAYPFWHSDLQGLLEEAGLSLDDGWLKHCMDTMRDTVPDHYQHTAAPGQGKIKNLLGLLGLGKPQEPIKRRF